MQYLRIVILALLPALVAVVEAVSGPGGASAAPGDHLWSKRFGDWDYQYTSPLGVDGSGNVLLGGTFRGTVDFGGGPLTSAGGTDIFLAKLEGGGAGSAVGGIAELPLVEPVAAGDDSGASSSNTGVLAALAAAVLVMLIAGAWYASRRWPRQRA